MRCRPPEVPICMRCRCERHAKLRGRTHSKNGGRGVERVGFKIVSNVKSKQEKPKTVSEKRYFGKVMKSYRQQ